MEQPLFRASEVLDMAVRVEQQGLAFYEACMGVDLGAETEVVLNYLIEQEKRHIEVFSGMKEGLAEFTLPESYAGEMGSYVDAFVKDKVFSDPEEASREVVKLAGPSQAIEWGISFERLSIGFYTVMKRIVRPSEGNAIEKIIAEEEAHVRRLLELDRNVRGER